MEEKRHPYFGEPPTRKPRPAVEVPALLGKRVILSLPEGFVYDMRAISQVRGEDGEDVIDVASEEHYFRWMFTKERPDLETFPVRLVWVE
jgi:hypothetical protein